MGSGKWLDVAHPELHLRAREPGNLSTSPALRAELLLYSRSVMAFRLHPMPASLCQLSGWLQPSALEPNPGPTGLARGDGSWAQG